MWWYRYLLGIILIFLGGCGYSIMSSSPIVLPSNINSLYISKITNPTTDPTLVTTIKTILMDEFSKRSSSLRWTSKNKAEGYIVVDITNYSKETEIENSREQTVESRVCISLRIFLYNTQSQKLIWDSQNITCCESTTNNESEQEIKRIQKKIIKDALEKITINLSKTF